jgi:gamma-glutamylcyclotransferase (GGCT)/AIG2-like uncharacterized protein YtfP
MRIFVYGTLKQGFHNHRCLEGAAYVREAYLSIPFRMFDTGGFPVLLPATANKPGYFPTGEVYELPEGRDGEIILARLDRLEGEGRMYHRQEHQTMDGEVVSVYIGDDDCWRRLDNQAYLGKNIHVDAAGEKVTYGRAA